MQKAFAAVPSLPPYLPARSSLTAADATTPTAPRPVEPNALQMTLDAASSARSVRGTDGDDELVSLLGAFEAWSAGAGVDVTPCMRTLGLLLGAGAFMWWVVPSCAGGGGGGSQGSKVSPVVRTFTADPYLHFWIHDPQDSQGTCEEPY